MSSIGDAIRTANAEGRLALAAFLTGGFPDKERFLDVMPSIAASVDILEIGIPFSDPMADGVSIQRASEVALRQGVTLRWILESIADAHLLSPVVFMSYLNPLLAFGIEDLARIAAESGVAGLIVPDLPYEEAHPFREVFAAQGIELVQLVTPQTPPERLKMICDFSGGFVYAVTMTGTTGGDVSRTEDVTAYLDRVRAASPIPVLAGFGIRQPEHIGPFAGHADGVIVGSALMDLLGHGEDPESFVQALRNATMVGNEVV